MTTRNRDLVAALSVLSDRLHSPRSGDWSVADIADELSIAPGERDGLVADDAMRRARALLDLADALDAAAASAVQDARDAGASWAAVGRSLGVTRQGAHKRFARRGSAWSRSSSYDTPLPL